MMASSIAARTALLWIASPVLMAIIFMYLLPTVIGAGTLQCKSLSLALPQKVSYPASSGYAQSASSYWSKQEESLAPSCIVSPSSKEDVVTAVKTLTLLKKVTILDKISLLNRSVNLQSTFAIRSGGHTPWAGSANINGGVTIDLRSISQVTVNQGKTVAYVGAGAIWGDVYQTLDSLGLTVVGGRGSSIGVGGLLTGGGQGHILLRSIC